MTYKELKKKLLDLDDDTKQVVWDNFGVTLECWDAEVRTVTKSRRDIDKRSNFFIPIEDAG